MVTSKLWSILGALLLVWSPVWADPTQALVKPANDGPVGWGHKPATTASWAQPAAKALPDNQPADPQKGLPLNPQTTGTDSSPAAAQSAPDKLARKVVIDIPSRSLLVMDGNRILQKFPVGVGRVGFMTPLGKYQVIRKIENPGWENPYKAAGAVKIRPGANNPLGTRWIGFKEDPRGEYGIHGTDSPQSVGKLSSHGCVRMRVPDAEKVFKLVELGTPVEVTYQVVQLSQSPDGDIRVTRYPDWFKRGVPSQAQVKKLIVQRFGEQATIDEAALSSALATATEKPVNIGTMAAAATSTPAVSSASPTATVK
jgi:lipoprotein-anchoring transpeptidase ErfK/SrfK